MKLPLNIQKLNDRKVSVQTVLVPLNHVFIAELLFIRYEASRYTTVFIITIKISAWNLIGSWNALFFSLNWSARGLSVQ